MFPRGAEYIMFQDFAYRQVDAFDIGVKRIEFEVRSWLTVSWI